MPRRRPSGRRRAGCRLALLRDGRLTFATLARRAGCPARPWCSASGPRTSCGNGRCSARGITSTRARAELAAQPIDAIELLVGLSGQYDEIEQYAENLMILREDLRDPVLRARGAAWEIELIAALDARCGTGAGRCSPRLAGRGHVVGVPAGRTATRAPAGEPRPARHASCQPAGDLELPATRGRAGRPRPPTG